jgi:hypothetical protein
MTHPAPRPAAEPVELLLIAGLAAAQALAVLIAAAVALLLALSGWRPAPAARPIPKPVAPAPADPPAPELAGLRVAELRALARAAGLPQLARKGRRAELLAALQPA